MQEKWEGWGKKLTERKITGDRTAGQRSRIYKVAIEPNLRGYFPFPRQACADTSETSQHSIAAICYPHKRFRLEGQEYHRREMGLGFGARYAVLIVFKLPFHPFPPLPLPPHRIWFSGLDKQEILK
jgi:hypothetical protein